MKISQVGGFGVGHHHEEIPIQFIQQSEVISGVKTLFNFSRFFGIPGISFFDNVVSQGSLWNFLSFWNIILLLNQIFLLGIRISKLEDFVKKSGPEIVMRVHVILVHLWSLIFSFKLASTLRSAPQVENRLKIYIEREYVSSLRRKCRFWTAIYILLGIGLSVKELIVPLPLQQKSIGDIWENYGQHCALTPKLLFHPTITSAYCLFSNWVTNFVWLFAEFFLIILSFILSELFHRLNLGIRAMEPGRFSAFEIDLVREHHGLALKLVNEFDKSVSPLNFINAVFNTTYIILGAYSILNLKSREKKLGMTRLITLYCNLAVAAFKLIVSLSSAAILHRKTQAGRAEVQSWPMAREFKDFSINNGRVGVIHAFLAQLSNSSSGFTIGKLVTITTRLILAVCLGLICFLTFARITLTSCSRTRSSSQ